MRYHEFDAHHFAKVRSHLILEKGGEFQKTFLRAALVKETFCDWLSKHLSVICDESVELPCHVERLTEEEFREPPPLVERMIFDRWAYLTPRETCRPSFWGYVTATNIREDVIKPHYLALNGQKGISGKKRIADALSCDDSKKIDDVARTILRRFSGLPEARGGLRSVSADCTLARAWWRERLLRDVGNQVDADASAVSRTLRLSKSYWEKLTMMIISRNSVLGDEKVRSVLIASLADLIEDSKFASLFKPAGLGQCVRLIGIQSAWKELAVLETEELQKVITDDIFEKMVSSSK